MKKFAIAILLMFGIPVARDVFAEQSDFVENLIPGKKIFRFSEPPVGDEPTEYGASRLCFALRQFPCRPCDTVGSGEPIIN